MKLYRINEDDLAELESLCPALIPAMMSSLDNCTRVKLRRIKEILSNVRWDYGPPEQVERIDAGLGDEP